MNEIVRYSNLDRIASAKKRELVWINKQCNYRDVFTNPGVPAYLFTHTPKQLNSWSVTTWSDKKYFNWLRQEAAQIELMKAA